MIYVKGNVISLFPNDDSGQVERDASKEFQMTGTAYLGHTRLDGSRRTTHLTSMVMITVTALCIGGNDVTLAQDAIDVSKTKISTDWPQWRGPDRTGRWLESGILKSFSTSSLTPKWLAKVGPGYSGPAVAGSRVFLTDRQAELGVERVLTFDKDTGDELWQFQYPSVYVDVDYASGPRATPTVDGDRVYVKGTMGHLFCLDVNDGSVIWKHDLVSQFNARIPTWGAVGAPLIDGDSLIVNVGGLPDASLVAFNKLTGAVRWQVLDDRPGYAPPIMIRAGASKQLIYWSAEGLNSLDPRNGSRHWQISFSDRADMTICVPVVHDDYLFVSSYYGGSMMVKLASDRPAAKVLWRDKRGVPPTLSLCISTPLFKGNHLYGIDRSGLLQCLEASTGKLVWESARATGGKEHGNAHITANGDREFLFNEAGELIITQLNPAGYQEISRTKLISPTAGVRDHRPVDWSHPAYADRHIFVRSDEELRCFSLAESN